MGEPKKLTGHSKEDKKRVAVNLAHGGGIGVGVIFIGGALATAALVSALTVGRRLLKPSNNKNRNHCPSTGSNGTPEKLIVESIGTEKDESKGILFLSPDPSPDVHQNLSNGSAKRSMTQTDTDGISRKSFFQEKNHNLDPYRGKGELICDDKEILLSSDHHGSDSSMQCDGAIVKTEEFSLPVVEDQMLFQSANTKEDAYGGEIDKIEEKNIIAISDVDRSTEEHSQLMQVNNDQKVGEGRCKEAGETAEADHSSVIAKQSSEEKESTLTDHSEDGNSTCCLPSISGVSVDQDFLVPLPYNSSLCKDEKLKIKREGGSQAFETVETSEETEAVRAVQGDKGQGDSMILMMKEKEKKCNQHDQVWLIAKTAEQLQRDETLEAAHVDHGKVNGSILMLEEEKIFSQQDDLLIVQTVDVLKREEKLDVDQEGEGNGGLLSVQIVEVHKRDEKLDADQADVGYCSALIMSGEEEKFDRPDGSLTVESARGALEPAQDKTQILMLEKEMGAHDDESDAAGEAAQSADPIASVSSSGLHKQEENPPIDIQDHHCVSDMKTFEKVTSESCPEKEPNFCLEVQGVPSKVQRRSGFDTNLKEVKPLEEATELGEGKISSKSEDRVIESDINPLKQSIGNSSDEMEDTSAPDSVYVTGQMDMSEEDSINDDTDEATITDKVEENSEGTGDSSVEYNTEPIWPAESLEELSTKLTELKLDNLREKQQAEENKTLQTEEKLHLNSIGDPGVGVESCQNINGVKDNLKMTFLENYMLELAEQNGHQIDSLKPRIPDVTWIFMLLLWLLCFWYFGLPFLKISLIVILIMLLSKIQGT